jgi:hypothetical protein
MIKLQAPSVYRPLPAPRVLQTKTRVPHVYRPQPVPKVLQTKSTQVQQTLQSSRQPAIPEHKLVQRKVMVEPRKPPAGPPIYRPQSPPRVLQKKESQTGTTVWNPTAVAAARSMNTGVGSTRMPVLTRTLPGVAQRSTQAHVSAAPNVGKTQVIQRKLKWDLIGGYNMAFLVMAEAINEWPQARELWKFCEWGEHSHNTHLRFGMTNNLPPTTLAITLLVAANNLTLSERSLLGSPEKLKLIDRNGPITIVVALNQNWDQVNDIGRCAETLAHEYVDHAVGWLELLKLLRNKKYTIDQIVQYQQEAKVGYESVHHQHHLLGQKQHQGMNVVVEKMHEMFVKFKQPDIASALAEEYEIDTHDRAQEYPTPKREGLKPTKLPVSHYL